MVARVTVDMLLRGTGKLDRQALQDELDKLKASVNVGGDAEDAVMTITTTKSNLSKVLDLATQIFKTPSFDNKEFEQYKSTQKVYLEETMQDPQALAFQQLSRLQNPFKKGHPRYVATFEERLAELAEVSLKNVKNFHQQFYGAQAMQIAVVGDFDQAAIQAQLDKLFGKWKANKGYQQITQPYHEMKPVKHEFNTPDKENAVFIAAIMLPVGENSEDAAALELGNYIFGGGFLSSRLAARLRQKDGLSYGAGSFLRVSDTDERTGMAAYAISAPQNLEKVETGFKEELARMLKDGFTDEEVQSAKSGLLQGKKVSRAQDQELVRILRNNVYLDRTMQWNEAYEKRLENLSTAEVNKVMNKYLSVDGFAIIKAGDMSKVEK
jgi:zinc protease